MPKRILIVEDNRPMRNLMRSALTTAFSDLVVDEAENGFAALKTLPSLQYDLVCTDINMPDINGLELIGFLRNHPLYKDVPIIIVSTEASVEDRKRGMEMGATDYLIKPFSDGDLTTLIQKHLDL